MWQTDLRVDNDTHVLHFRGHDFPCDRDVEAVQHWQGQALLLSSDTDCLSLWDEEGLIRTARVGVYPQDVAVAGDIAVICGGTDGRLHLLSLPDLFETADYPVPGMPERLCLRGDNAWVLTLLPEPEIHTMLLTIDLSTGKWTELRRFSGIPEAITADERGLWVAVSEGAVRLTLGELDT